MTTSHTQPNRIKPQQPFLTVCRLWAVKVVQWRSEFARTSHQNSISVRGSGVVLHTQNTPGLVAHPKRLKPDRVGVISRFYTWFDPVRTQTTGAKTCFEWFYTRLAHTQGTESGLHEHWRGNSHTYSQAIEEYIHTNTLKPAYGLGFGLFQGANLELKP